MRPEAIFLGHGHGDHADNAAYVAKWTGATIYASPETCDVMQQDVIRMWNDPNAHNGGAKIIPDGNPVKCEGAVPRGSPPGEYTGTLANPSGGTINIPATAARRTAGAFTGIARLLAAHAAPIAAARGRGRP